ncbi:MAG: glycoside hydrolase [Alteromonadaceae bacterium]|nr:glycoside hydrolase [Alteromonadaceae bacterium]
MTIKVMHVELGRQLYGGAKQVEYLINALPEDTITSHLVCASDSAISHIPAPGCIKHPVPYSGDTDLWFPFRLYRLIKRSKPDILHIHSRRGADVWGGLVSALFGIPAVCTRRVDNKESALAALKYRHYKAVVSISQGVHDVVSRHCKQILQPVIHSAVDLNDFRYSRDAEWFREKYDIPANHKVIANFAQLIPRKGQKDLIMAMQAVIARRQDVTCLLFGKGKQQAAYQQLADDSGAGKNIRLCGFTSDVPRILPNIDVMVHPAYAEGLGIILLQAGACKVPMISCPVGGIPEIIHNEKTGLLVEPGDPPALAREILRLLDNPAEARALGENAFHHVQQHFSIAAMADAYTGLYKSLV